MRAEAGLSVAAPKLGSKAEDELSFKGFRRLLHSKRVAAQLEKESSHHTASYQYRVLEKVIQMLIHGHIEISDLSEARPSPASRPSQSLALMRRSRSRWR